MFYFLKDVVYTRIIVILKTTFDYDVQFDCPLLLSYVTMTFIIYVQRHRTLNVGLVSFCFDGNNVRY